VGVNADIVSNPELPVEGTSTVVLKLRARDEIVDFEKSLISIHGSYSMKLGVVDLDVLFFRACFIRIKNNPATEDLKALDELYTGEYMEGADWRWAEIERERLSRQYGQIVVGLSQAYIEKRI